MSRVTLKVTDQNLDDAREAMNILVATAEEQGFMRIDGPVFEEYDQFFGVWVLSTLRGTNQREMLTALKYERRKANGTNRG